MTKRQVIMRAERIDLALFTKNEIDEVQSLSLEINAAGEFWPLSDFRANELYADRIAKDGYFSQDNGRLLIVDKQGKILGFICYFKPVFFWNALEIGFRIYSPEDWGKGFATNAVRLTTSFIFERIPITRIQITADPENLAVERIALKCGFVKEGILRNTEFKRGRVSSSAIYSIVPNEAPSLQSLLLNT